MRFPGFILTDHLVANRRTIGLVTIECQMRKITEMQA